MGTTTAIALERHGAVSAAPPLVLIHGVGTNRSIWSRSVPALAKRRTVITLDLPGFGESPAPEGGGWTIAGSAASICAALTAEIEPPFDLCGSSLGGAVALELAAANPDLVDKLVLCAPAGFRPVPRLLPLLAGAAVGPFLTARREAGSRLAGLAAARRITLAGTIADGARLDPATARLMLAASAGSASLGPAFRAAAAANLTATLDAGPDELGLIWGSADRVIPAGTAARILALRPRARLELIPGAGHIPHLERPELFVPALERLLERLPSARASA